ncbi:MAG: hypothetical protein ABSH17_01320 [Syntrophobacteraceae bacterium]
MGNLFKWLLPVFIACFGIGSFLPVAVFAGPETSSIIIGETNYNFGQLSEMEPLFHDFIVKNGGKAILNIRDVQPG